MLSLNRVFLAGNLTRDPEVRYVSEGNPVGELRLAVSNVYRTRDGQDKEDTCFVDVIIWGRQAEPCGKFLRKGSPVFVEGRLQFEQWEKDGQKRSRLRVVASRVQFLGSPKGGGSAREMPEGGGPVRETSEDGPAPQAGDDGPPAAERLAAGPGGDEDNLPF